MKKNVILIFLAIICFQEAFAQTKYFLPEQIVASNNRPIKDATVKLYNTGTVTLAATLTYLKHSAGRYYWTGGTTTVPWGDYDIYVNIAPTVVADTTKAYMTQVSIRNGYTVNQVTRDSLAAVLSDSIGSIVQVDDTTELKLQTHAEDGFIVSMKSLSSSNIFGGGSFIQKSESDYPIDHINVFDNATAGKVWVELSYYLYAPINPKSAGAKGDGVADEITFLEDAKRLSLTQKKPFYIPQGTYDLSTSLSDTSLAQQATSYMLGDGIKHTTLNFTSNSAGVKINRSTTVRNHNTIIKDLEIQGPGSSTSTVPGVEVDTTAYTWLEKLRIDGFKYGVFMDQPNAPVIMGSQIQNNKFGVYLTGASNEFAFLGNYITLNDSVGLYNTGASKGGVVVGGAIANQPYQIMTDNGASVTTIGTNFESADSSFATVKTNSTQFYFGSTFLRGSAPRIAEVEAGATLHIGGMKLSNFSGTNNRVELKAASGTVINTGNTAFMVYDETNDEHFLANPFDHSPSNASFAADSTERGMFQYKYARNDIDQDNFILYGKVKGTSYHPFHLADGSDWRFSSTSGGGAFSRADQIVNLVGKFTGTSSAGDSTNFTINITDSDINTDYVYLATVRQTGMKHFLAVIGDRSGATIPGAVWHKYDTGGSISFTVYVYYVLKANDGDFY